MAPWLLPFLFTGGSMIANTIGANQQGDAIADAQNAERLRQKRFDEESMVLNNNSRERFGDVPEQIDTKAGDLAAMFLAPSQESPAAPIITTPESSSNIVTSRENALMAKAKGETDARAANLGNLRAFGDVLGDASRMQGRDAGQLGLIGSMRRGSQAVLPMELEAAQYKGARMRTLGDILSAAGMFAGGPAGAAGGGINGNSAFFNPFFGGPGLGGFN